MININKSSYCASEQDYLADESLYQVIEDIVKIYIPLVLALCGVVSNFINMVIFSKLGLKDSMSISLLALSVVDFLTTLLVGMICVCFLIGSVYPNKSKDALSLGYYGFGYTMNAMYLTSCWITALITMERCFCVVFPFTSKLIFTKRRSVFIIAAIGILHIALHIPLYGNQRTECSQVFQKLPRSEDTATSVYDLVTLVNKQVARLHMVFDIIVSVALGNVSFIIVIVCTVWMIHALQATSRIRHAVSLKPDFNDKQSQLSTRERKLVKVALALAIILSLCGLPRIVIVAFQVSISQGDIFPVSQYIELMWGVAYVCSTFGCFITIFVYLSLNNNYRLTLKTSFNIAVR